MLYPQLNDVLGLSAELTDHAEASGQRGAGNAVSANANSVETARKIGDHAEDANGAGNRGWLCVNGICIGRYPIAARGRYVAKGSHHGLTSLLQIF